MKVGDKLTIHCYKHNGKIDRISGEAIVLDETDEYLVCANNKVKLIENDGRSHRTKEIAILFFYKKEWYTVTREEHHGTYYTFYKNFTRGAGADAGLLLRKGNNLSE